MNKSNLKKLYHNFIHRENKKLNFFYGARRQGWLMTLNLNIYREEDNLVCILSYCLLLLIMNNAMNTKKEILHNTLLT